MGEQPVTSKLDLTAMILKKFDILTAQVSELAQSMASTATQTTAISGMISRMETTIDRLEAHDTAMDNAVSDLRLATHRLEAALTVVSSTAQQAVTSANQNASEIQKLTIERDGVSRHLTRRERDLDDVVKLAHELEDEIDRLAGIPKKVEDACNDMMQWRPWLRAIRWVVIAVASVAVLAMAAWLLRGIAEQVLINLSP